MVTEAPSRARKKKSVGSTAVVRLAADLASMLTVITAVTGEEVAAILSPLVREAITARYREVVRRLNEQLKGE